MFKKPFNESTHIKAVIWGEPGSGKTVFALKGEQVALLDLENGADRYANFFNFYALKVGNFDQIEEVLLDVPVFFV